MTGDTSTDRTYHVAPSGRDDGPGDREDPLRTVSAAAERTVLGDTVRIHDGVYRERVDPPRGGAQESPIVFEAAPGAAPVLKGSIVLDDWRSIGDGCWETECASDRFETPHPFDDLLRGHWFDDFGRNHHRGMVYAADRPLPEATGHGAVVDADHPCWYATVDGATTTIRVALESDIEATTIEATTRPAVFYPSEPGVDHITLRGLTLKHAATQWAPPTLEQIGIVGTNWSRGWLVEDCVISGSRCAGLTLGLYGDWREESPWEGSADGYNQTIRDAIENGWERGRIGDHKVTNCEISHCGQAGIVGSMGAAFSEVRGNHIHHINTHRQFAGAELAGIKFHGAVDTVIAGNYSHHARRGLWLDWMTQGTRVRANCFHDNDIEDCYMEVNHGPFLLDSNLLLSERALRVRSQGGAYVHNLFAGDIVFNPERNRSTPYFEPHETTIAGIESIPGGDERFYNNFFVGGTGLGVYADPEYPIAAADNVYLNGAESPPQEPDPCVLPHCDPAFALEDDGDAATLSISVDPQWGEVETSIVTTEGLGRTVVSEQPFTAPDGCPITVDLDYTGTRRDPQSPAVGPFEDLGGVEGTVQLDLWPR